MHSSTSLLAAAGLLSLAFAAPVSQDIEKRATVTYSEYAQCGGENFVVTGVCPTGQICVYSNDWYSQCVAGTATSSSKAAVKTSSAIKVATSSSKVVMKTSSAVKIATSSSKAVVKSSSAVKIATSSTKAVVKSTSTSVVAAQAVSTSSKAVVKSSSSSSKAVVKSTSTKALVASTTAAAVVSTSTAGLQWLGVTESGAEFGTTVIPGVLGTDYTWPLTSSVQTLLDTGMNIIRIPFLMERLAQGTMTATLDATYLAALKTLVDFVTAAGAHAVIDPHNFGRYDGTVFTSTSDFQTFWTNVATVFATNDLVVFDCMNEFHDEPTDTTVAELSQACIDGVRAAGATTQYIFVEGTSYTGAWTWTTSGNSDNMGNLTDPEDKIIYEMHQYLDSDGSGTSSTCVSSTIGAERIADATTWLRTNGKRGVIGEFAGGANTMCETAVEGMLDYMVTNNDVWLGAMAWAAGPWWADYIFSMEPSTGTMYEAYMTVLKKYTP